jgi:hypothetical protein
MSEHEWISGAIRHHGIFRAAAKKAGMSTESYARLHEHASGVVGHRARLALTLMHLNHHDETQTPAEKAEKRFRTALERNG